MHRLRALAALVLAWSPAAQTPCTNQMSLPDFGFTYSHVVRARGFHFQAPIPFLITHVEVPDEARAGYQSVEILIDSSPFAALPGTTTPTQAFYRTFVPSGAPIATGGILVRPGDYVGILGACSDAVGSKFENSYAPVGAFMSDILGNPVRISRLISQTSLAVTGPRAVSTEDYAQIGRVEVCVAPAPGYALAMPFGQGCGGTRAALFYEQFHEGNAFDLTRGFRLGSPAGEVTALPGQHPIVVPSGVALTIGDDETIPIALPWTMPTWSGATQMLWVCSNGWIALEPTAENTGLESALGLANGPARVCAMWDDFDPAPSGGGTVHAEPDPSDPNLFHVTWTDVLEYFTTRASTFQVSFRSDGSIEVKYGPCMVRDCIAGYSHGGAYAVPDPVDLSDPALSVPTGVGRGPLDLRAVDRPVLGTMAAVEVAELPPGAVQGAFLLGFSGFRPGIDLGALGMPGCELYTSASIASPFTATGPTERLAVPMGTDPASVGWEVFWQAAVLEPGANAADLITSNGLLWNPEFN